MESCRSSSARRARRDSAPLLQLPLELREAIYAHLSISHDDIDGTSLNPGRPPVMPITLYLPAPPQAYLICRQITTELRDQVSRTGFGKFTLQDDLVLGPRRYPDIKPAYRNLEIPLEASLIALCDPNDANKWSCEAGGNCSVLRLVYYDQFDMKNMCAQLGPLPALKLNFYVSWNEMDTAGWPHSWHGDILEEAVKHMVKLWGVTELRVYKLYESGKHDIGSQRDVWVSWSAQGGYEVPKPEESG